MDQTARLTVLQSSSFFGGLTPNILSEVAEAAHESDVTKDSALFQQGDIADHHYMVAWGRLRLDKMTPDGKNVVIRYMGPGELVGSVAVFRNIRYPATPTAVEDTHIFSWGASCMASLIEVHPPLAMKALSMVGGRVEELQQRLQEISTQQVERRIASAILRIARQSGRRVEAGIEIPFAVSRQDLAELTGTTLHTVSRTLSAWMKDGILEGRRSSHLVITRPHRLVEIAEEA